MKKLFIFLFLISTITKAQDGFVIKINTTNCQGYILEMFEYQGTTSLVKKIDSTKIVKPNQLIEFKNLKKTEGLMVQLKVLGNPNFINLALDNGANLSLTLSNGNIETLKAVNSEEINKFFDYQKLKQKEADQSVLRLDYLKKNTNSIEGLYYKLDQKRSDAYPKTYDEAYESKKHFFDGIDKNDNRLRKLPNTFAYYFKYITLLPINNDFYKGGVDSLMKGVEVTNKNYAFNLSWVFKNLMYFKNDNLEKAYVDIYKKYVEMVNVKFENPAENSIVASKARIAEKLANGTHIPEVELVDTLNVSHKLSEITAANEYTFLIFYDPDCHHCQAAIKSLNTFFDENPFYLKKIKRVAILNVPTDANKWIKFIAKKNLGAWLNLKSNDPARKYEKDFETYFNPVFFLIDKNGIIVDKSGESERLVHYVGKL